MISREQAYVDTEKAILQIAYDRINNKSDRLKKLPGNKTRLIAYKKMLKFSDKEILEGKHKKILSAIAVYSATNNFETKIKELLK